MSVFAQVDLGKADGFSGNAQAHLLETIMGQF